MTKSGKKRKVWVGWMVMENGYPVRFYLFKEDAVNSCCGTSANTSRFAFEKIRFTTKEEL